MLYFVLRIIIRNSHLNKLYYEDFILPFLYTAAYINKFLLNSIMLVYQSLCPFLTLLPCTKNADMKTRFAEGPNLMLCRQFLQSFYLTCDYGWIDPAPIRLDDVPFLYTMSKPASLVLFTINYSCSFISTSIDLLF